MRAAHSLLFLHPFLLRRYTSLKLVAKQGPHQVIMLGILMERCLVSTDRCELLFMQVKKIYIMSFFIEEKDMESDEALWALYHRWCKHHKVQRDHDDMVRPFDEFKYCVRHVHRVNSLGLDIRLGLNKNSDIPLSEMYSSTPMISDEAYERFKALSGCTIEFESLTDDDD
jgi:hypothetical protein